MPNPNNCLRYWDLADHIRIGRNWPGNCCPAPSARNCRRWRKPYEAQIDQPLLVALTRAFYWQQLLDDGVVASGSEIARREGLHHSTVNELLRLTLLQPAIIQAILAGKQPRCMSLLWFQRNPLPTDWVAQREVLARFDA